MTHDEINDIWACGVLYIRTVMARRELQCELCGDTRWLPVKDEHGQRVGNLVTCSGCRIVYAPPPEPPTMGRRAPGEAPDFGVGWKK